MHGPAGHTTHLTDSVGSAIREEMKDCDWQRRVNKVLPAIDKMRMELKSIVEDSAEYHESESLRQLLSNIRRQITKYNNQAAKIEEDSNSTPAKIAEAEKLRAKATQFADEADNTRQERIAHTKSTDYGEYTQILAGLKEFEQVMLECSKAESKQASSDGEFVFWKALESRAKG